MEHGFNYSGPSEDATDEELFGGDFESVSQHIAMPSLDGQDPIEDLVVAMLRGVNVHPFDYQRELTAETRTKELLDSKFPNFDQLQEKETHPIFGSIERLEIEADVEVTTQAVQYVNLMETCRDTNSDFFWARFSETVGTDREPKLPLVFTPPIVMRKPSSNISPEFAFKLAPKTGLVLRDIMKKVSGSVLYDGATNLDDLRKIPAIQGTNFFVIKDDITRLEEDIPPNIKLITREDLKTYKFKFKNIVSCFVVNNARDPDDIVDMVNLYSYVLLQGGELYMVKMCPTSLRPDSIYFTLFEYNGINEYSFDRCAAYKPNGHVYNASIVSNAVLLPLLSPRFHVCMLQYTNRDNISINGSLDVFKCINRRHLWTNDGGRFVLPTRNHTFEAKYKLDDEPVVLGPPLIPNTKKWLPDRWVQYRVPYGYDRRGIIQFDEEGQLFLYTCDDGMVWEYMDKGMRYYSPSRKGTSFACYVNSPRGYNSTIALVCICEERNNESFLTRHASAEYLAGQLGEKSCTLIIMKTPLDTNVCSHGLKAADLGIDTHFTCMDISYYDIDGNPTTTYLPDSFAVSKDAALALYNCGHIEIPSMLLESFLESDRTSFNITLQHVPQQHFMRLTFNSMDQKPARLCSLKLMQFLDVAPMFFGALYSAYRTEFPELDPVSLPLDSLSIDNLFFSDENKLKVVSTYPNPFRVTPQNDVERRSLFMILLYRCLKFRDAFCNHTAFGTSLLAMLKTLDNKSKRKHDTRFSATDPFNLKNKPAVFRT